MIRVFPRRNKWTPVDGLAFVGYPPLFRPPQQPVRVSTIFTWDIPLAMRLAKAWGQLYPDVQVGGPAFGDPGGEFTPGQYIKDGVTITSRGCPHACPWCHVPGREGKIRELQIKPGYIVQDNNLLACSRKHLEAVFDMLRQQSKAAEFKGGLDSKLLQPWHKELFDSIRVREYWWACDTAANLPLLERVAKIMDGTPAYLMRAYTMIGFDGETLNQAAARLQSVFDLGFFPFAQLYQGKVKKEYDAEWSWLAKYWSRPGLYNSKH